MEPGLEGVGPMEGSENRADRLVRGLSAGEYFGFIGNSVSLSC